jgi:cell division protein FtsI (penicillin-binding protein 3)
MPEIDSNRRLHWLLWALLVWTGAIFGRLLWLQVVRHDELLKLARQQQQRTVEVPAIRGSILDRNGQPLAKSLPGESICVNPFKIPDPGMAADLLSRLLEIDRAKLYDHLRSAKSRGSGFLWVKRKATAEEAERVRSLKLDWVEFRPEMRRFYPKGTLAAHVVGSTGFVDDAEEHGTAGIEAAFDEDLAGRPGLEQVFTDVRQNPYDSLVSRKPEPGSNLTLSIDSNLQYTAERELDKAIESSGAATGSIVVVNPHTGDVLAMANYPRFDPNMPPGRNEPPNARSNLAVTTPFEPGSVFKVITLTAALESTSLRPDSIINCGNGQINLFGRVIHDHDRYSALAMADVLAKSSNIGAIQIGLKVGERNLYSYVRKFGFGRKTGIELPGESSGMVRRVEQWTPSSIGSVAMGHEVSATSLQLALAGAAVANGGMLVKPRLVMARQRQGQPTETLAADRPERIMRPETAIQMRQMMEGVVLRGTGKKAALAGYTSGGKTGSAQVYDLRAHVYTHTYNASFLGFAPVVNPQIVVAVTLNGTTHGTAGFGGAVAAPVFREVATTALRIFDVPKDLPSKEPPDNTLRTSNAQPAPAPVENDLAIAGLGDSPDKWGEPQASRDFSDSAAFAGAGSKFAHGTQSVRSRSVSSVTPPPVHMDGSGLPGTSRAEAQADAQYAEAQPVDRRLFLTASAEPYAALPPFGPARTPPSRGGPKTPDFRGMPLSAVLAEAAATGLSIEVQGNGLARVQDPPPGSYLPPRGAVRVQFGK